MFNVEHMGRVIWPNTYILFAQNVVEAIEELRRRGLYFTAFT